MKRFPSGPCRLSIHRQILAIALAPALVVTSLLVFVVYQGNLQHNRWLLDQHGQLLAAQLAGALEYGLATPGPHLIEALVPESLAGAKRRVLPWLLRSLPSLPRPVALALKRKIAP